MFEDREDNNGIWIETNFKAKIMYFSKGFSDDPDLIIELPNIGEWQFDGIHDQDISDIDQVWDLGKNFEDDPEKVHKREQRRHLEHEIDKIDKLREHYETELKKL